MIHLFVRGMYSLLEKNLDYLINLQQSKELRAETQLNFTLGLEI